MREEEGRPTSASLGDMTSTPSKSSNMMHSDPGLSIATSLRDDLSIETSQRKSSFSTYDTTRLSGEGSPMMMSPWCQNSFFTQSPWDNFEIENPDVPVKKLPQNALVGSIVREEGHIYSLAATRDLLYTGSESKNIRVWKNLYEFSAFKSNSGLVKAIIICGGKIFTGHQDGKVRVWKAQSKNPDVHKRSGTLPTFIDIFKCSIKPKNYVEVKRNKTSVWIKHGDAISSLSMNQEKGLLYSASWDKTFKVWKVDNSKCLESVKAHEDAVNSIVAGGNDMVFTGSADGSVKVWRREAHNKGTKHILIQTLLSQECAITSLVIDRSHSILYCGSSDGLVNFWECEKQLSHGGVLKGHKLAILCLAASGNLLYSGSADKTICVWKRMEGLAHSCLSVLTGHTGPVKCLAVEKDPETTDANDQRWLLYSGSLDKSVKVWSVSEQSPDFSEFQQGDDSWDSIPPGFKCLKARRRETCRPRRPESLLAGNYHRKRPHKKPNDKNFPNDFTCFLKLKLGSFLASFCQNSDNHFVFCPYITFSAASSRPPSWSRLLRRRLLIVTSNQTVGGYTPVTVTPPRRARAHRIHGAAAPTTISVQLVRPTTARSKLS